MPHVCACAHFSAVNTMFCDKMNSAIIQKHVYIALSKVSESNVHEKHVKIGRFVKQWPPFSTLLPCYIDSYGSKRDIRKVNTNAPNELFHSRDEYNVLLSLYHVKMDRF